jgi:dTDP-glucose 4,6-dehydratase
MNLLGNGKLRRRMTLFEPPRRVLVTGGAGFIGSAVCRRLAAGGAAVLNVDSLTYAGHPGSVADLEGAPGYVFARADIRDRAAVAALMASFRPAAVVNLAAETHVDRSIMNADAFVTTNVVGVQILLDCARAHRDGLNGEERDRFRFLQVSTDEVYGSLTATEAVRRDDAPMIPPRPTPPPRRRPIIWSSPGRAPTACRLVMSNCSNNYGPFQFPEKLIPLMILDALHGRPLPVYGRRNAEHARLAACRGSRRGARGIVTRGRTGEKYNVGAPQRAPQHRRGARRSARFSTGCARTARRTSDLIAFVTDRPGHDARYAIDRGQARSRTRLAPAQELRHRTREDGALVSRQRMVVAPAARQASIAASVSA